jgi:Rps23 Pro-64 3,4-dihydroxylase Tpa1-like proline 4-hydroxylase
LYFGLFSGELHMKLENETTMRVDDRVTSTDSEAPFRILDDFLPAALAQAMQTDIQAHFCSPERHSAERHQIWNYWYVSDLYAYLRTSPERVIERIRVEEFMNILRRWAENELGLSLITWPYLSLYVPGCRQGVHNDSANGRFGFVYSLTKASRSSIGGDTIIYRAGDPFRSKLRTPSAGTAFFERVPPQFNRLLVFDDRLPHAVDRVDGSMDPVEGRLVLHGHLSEGGPIVRGALPLDVVADQYVAVALEFCSRAAARMTLLHGLLSLKFRILSSGKIEGLRVLVNRVVCANSSEREWPRLLQLLLALVRDRRFETSDGLTEVVFPFVFGGPIVGGSR